MLNIDLSKCQFTSAPIILAKTVTKDHLIPTENYQVRLRGYIDLSLLYSAIQIVLHVINSSHGMQFSV